MVFSSQKNLLFALAAGVSFCVAGAMSTRAATTTVQVGQGGLVFVPSTVNINAGDTVIWNWASSDHTTTSQSGSATTWNSGLFNSPHAFTNSFPTAGTFPFECQIHVSEGMTGKVIAATVAPHVPPTVSITSPASGTVLSAPANVTIQASASDSDGHVTNVQFIVDANFLANFTPPPNSTATPASGTASNLAAGPHTLTAIVSDNFGATGTNSVTLNVVTPVAVNLSQQKLSAGTNFSFSYSADVGLNYVVLRSTNLASPSWTALLTNKATSNPMSFTDSNAVANPGLYRVGRLPNP